MPQRLLLPPLLPLTSRLLLHPLRKLRRCLRPRSRVRLGVVVLLDGVVEMQVAREMVVVVLDGVIVLLLSRRMLVVTNNKAGCNAVVVGAAAADKLGVEVVVTAAGVMVVVNKVVGQVVGKAAGERLVGDVGDGGMEAQMWAQLGREICFVFPGAMGRLVGVVGLDHCLRGGGLHEGFGGLVGWTFHELL